MLFWHIVKIAPGDKDIRVQNKQTTSHQNHYETFSGDHECQSKYFWKVIAVCYIDVLCNIIKAWGSEGESGLNIQFTQFL